MDDGACVLLCHKGPRARWSILNLPSAVVAAVAEHVPLLMWCATHGTPVGGADADRTAITISAATGAARARRLDDSFWRRFGSVRSVVFAAVGRDGLELERAPIAMRGDREVVLAAVCQNGLALKHAEAVLRSDEGLVLTACAQAPRSMRHGCRRLRASPLFMGRAVECSGGAVMRWALDDALNDRALVLVGVTANAACLAMLPSRLRDDKEIALAAVRCDGRCLADVSPRLRSDRDVITAAVFQNAAHVMRAGLAGHDPETVALCRRLSNVDEAKWIAARMSVFSNTRKASKSQETTTVV